MGVLGDPMKVYFHNYRDNIPKTSKEIRRYENVDKLLIINMLLKCISYSFDICNSK